MAQSLYTPLQLTVIAGMLNNQGIASLPPALTNSLNAYNDTPLISLFLSVVNYYVSQSWSTPETLSTLLSIGSASCPALGDSIPAAYTSLTPPASTPWGFSGLVETTGNEYLGNGDGASFAEGFMSVQAYINSTNAIINSVANAQTYLGPTFGNMNTLVTNNISNVNSNFQTFGTDLANQGQLTNLNNIQNYGTPAALLQQIAAVGDLQGGMLSGVEEKLLAEGLNTEEINILLNQIVVPSLIEFNKLQRAAYSAFQNVTGVELQTVLDILDVTTPNIDTMADLLNPQKIFPNSWQTMLTPSPDGPIPIYLPDGSVDMNIEANVNNYLPTATGCEEMSKIVPPGIAIANKAVQTSLQQITGLPQTTLSNLAAAVWGTSKNTWDINSYYLPNTVVSVGAPLPVFYRAQQDVPPGTDINNGNYWVPTTLGGMNTMAGLDFIQQQTQPIAQWVIDYFTENLATGTGPNGTITTYDVLGLAANYNNVSGQFDTVTTAVNYLDNVGALNALKTTYTNMLSATDDATMQGYIATADSDIAGVASAYPTQTNAMNNAFDSVAAMIVSEKSYQADAGTDYTLLGEGANMTVYAFASSLPSYASQTQPYGPAEFLDAVSDTSTPAGQAIVGTMREARNNVRLFATQLGLATAPSTVPPVIPSPVIKPVY